MSNLAAALVKAQQEFPHIPLDSTNPHFKNKFASLGSILDKTLPALHKNGLALIQHPTTVDGKPALRTVLLHESGEREEDTMLLILDKENSQGQGSALTYAKRQAVTAVLGLVADEDDDGQAASAPPKKKRAAAPANGPAEELTGRLLEIDVILTALAEAKSNDKADWIKTIDEQAGESWRTDADDAAIVLAKVRRWAKQADVQVSV